MSRVAAGSHVDVETAFAERLDIDVKVPLLSVIITNYNYGRFLRDAIESSLRQSYAPIEVIVVDDGSEDNSRDVIREFEGRVEVVFKENGGQASAFSAGLSCSRGDVVIFLDADDVLLPETAAMVVEALSAHPLVAKIQYRMEVMDANGKRTGVPMPDPHIPLKSGDLRAEALSFPADIPRMATSGNAFPAWLLRELSPIPDTGDGHGADWYLTYLSLLFGPVVTLEHVGALYRSHGTNFFGRTSALDLEHVRLAIRRMQYMHVQMKECADRLGLAGFPSDPSTVPSIAFLSTRLISLKLDPENHPIADDTVRSLLGQAIVAVHIRFDASFPMKLAYLLWFLAMTPAPAPVADWLAQLLIVPESRGIANRVLGLFHRLGHEGAMKSEGSRLCQVVLRRAH